MIRACCRAIEAQSGVHLRETRVGRDVSEEEKSLRR